ncbi:MAG TPA: phage tail tape measure protein, partial [Parvularculaceae bacterium]|nr:phage tail tape measure protein [Parvularculaceae bacterium]
ANFKQAGFDAKEAAELTRVSLDLMIAGDIDASQGADLLVASLKGFQLEAGEAAKIVDLLNAASNEYATGLPELIDGFAKLSPVAKAAGLSLEETVGLLVPGIEVFRSGSEVANALKTSLLNLQSSSKPVQEALAAIGVSQRDTNGELRSARDIYFDVATAFGSLGDNQKTYYAAQLVGLDQSAKFISVTEGLSKTLRISGGDFEYAGSAAKEVEVRLASAETAVKRMGEAFKSALRGIGDPLLDEFAGTADGISGIFREIGRAIETGAFADIQGALEKVGKEFNEFLGGIAKALPEALAGVDFSGVVSSYSGIAEAMKGIFGDLDLTKPEDLRRAIQFVTDSLESLNLVVAGIVTAWRPAIATILDAVNDFNGLSDAAKIGTGEALGFAQVFEKIVGPIVESVSGAIGGLGDALTLFSAVIGGTLLTNAAALVASLGGMSAALGKVGVAGAAGAAGYAIGSELNPYIDKLVSRLTGSETTLGSWIYDLVNGKDAAEGLGTAAGNAAEGVRKLDDAAATGGAGQLAAEAEKIAASLDGIDGAVSKVTRGAFVDYKDAIGNVITTMTASGQSLESWNDSLLRSGGVVEDAAGKLSDLDKAAGGIGENIGKASESFGGLDKAVRALVIDGPGGGTLVRFYDEMGRVTERTFATREEADKFSASLKGGNLAMSEAAGAAGAFADTTGDLADSAKKLSPIFDAATGEIIGYEQNLGYVEATSKKVAKSQDEAAAAIKTAREEAQKAEEATRAWNLEMAKLASAEAIAMISSQTQVATEQIKSDAVQMVAAFESVSTSIESTNALIGDLYGKTSEFDRFGLIQNSLLRSADERARALTEAQVKLLNEQAENLRQRTENLARGESLIKIEGDGLQPHLEAFMWEILKAIQLRVNADGLDMLLGVTPA